MTSGGSGGCRSRGRRDAIPKPVRRTSSPPLVHQNISRFDIFVDGAALVHLANSCGHADGEAQETLNIHRHAEEPAEQLAPGILEHQNGPTPVSQAPAAARPTHCRAHPLRNIRASRRLSGAGLGCASTGNNSQRGFAAAAPSSAENKLCVLRQHSEIIARIGPRGRIQSRYSI